MQLLRRIWRLLSFLADIYVAVCLYDETFKECPISFKFKKGDPALAGFTTGIHGVFCWLKFKPAAEIEGKGALSKGLIM